MEGIPGRSLGNHEGIVFQRLPTAKTLTMLVHLTPRATLYPAQ